MDRLYNTIDPQYRGDDRSTEEIINGERGGDYWTPSDHPVENDFSNIDVIQLLDEDVVVADGGRTPEEIFNVLYEEDTNCPEYAIASGAVFDYLTQDVRASNSEALKVTRKIQKGEVGEAEKMFEDILSDQQ